MSTLSAPLDGARPAGEPPAAATAGPVAGDARPVEILGRWPDFLLFGAGGTLLIFLLLRFSTQVLPGVTVAQWALVLSLAIVAPHYAATYRRAYGTREIFLQHWPVTLVAPLALLVPAVASVRAPATVAPWFLLAYVIWSGYHYSGQSLGIAMLYPLRQGKRLQPDEKRLLSLPLYASWLLSLAGVFQATNPGRNNAFAYVHDAFPRVHLGTGWLLAMGAVLLASLAGPLVVAVRRHRAGYPLPAQVYMVLGAQVLWFAWGLVDPFFAALTVPVLHSLQYLALTTWHHLRARPSRGQLAVYAVTLSVIGAVTNEVLPRVLGAAGVSALVLGPVVASYMNLHHFMLDGRIWKLRDARVARSFT
jgi:hypothetical protein